MPQDADPPAPAKPPESYPGKSHSNSQPSSNGGPRAISQVSTTMICDLVEGEPSVSTSYLFLQFIDLDSNLPQPLLLPFKVLIHLLAFFVCLCVPMQFHASAEFLDLSQTPSSLTLAPPIQKGLTHLFQSGPP